MATTHFVSEFDARSAQQSYYLLNALPLPGSKLLKRVWSLWALGRPGDRRAGRAEDDTALPDLDPCFGISGNCQAQTFDKMGTEATYPAETGAELSVDRWPPDLDVTPQGVESIGEPDIDIDDHGTRSYGPES